MKKLEQDYHIHAPVALVWQALTDAQMIEEWGGGPGVVMDEHEGTEFALWGGDIHGENLHVTPEQLLVQSWWSDGFEEASEVRFELSQDGEDTLLRLVQRHIPDDHFHDIADGWHQYYLGPLQEYVEHQ